MQRAWNKYGPDVFSFEMLEYCEPAVLIAREQHYIDTMKPRYNRNMTAGKPPVSLHTDETRAAVSARFKGRRHTELTKQRMSEASKGKPKSPEHAEKIRAMNKMNAEKRRGISHTDETKERMSQAARKRNESDPSMRWLDEGRRKRAKLTPDQVIEVRKLRRSGVTQASVAAMFGVGYWVINAIMSGKSFQYVPDVP